MPTARLRRQDIIMTAGVATGIRHAAGEHLILRLMNVAAAGRHVAAAGRLHISRRWYRRYAAQAFRH